MKAGEAGEAYNICHDEETRSIASIAQLVATHVSNNKSKLFLIFQKMYKGSAMHRQYTCS